MAKTSPNIDEAELDRLIKEHGLGKHVELTTNMLNAVAAALKGKDLNEKETLVLVGASFTTLIKTLDERVLPGLREGVIQVLGKEDTRH